MWIYFACVNDKITLSFYETTIFLFSGMSWLWHICDFKTKEVQVHWVKTLMGSCVVVVHLNEFYRNDPSHLEPSPEAEIWVEDHSETFLIMSYTWKKRLAASHMLILKGVEKGPLESLRQKKEERKQHSLTNACCLFLLDRSAKQMFSLSHKQPESFFQ